MFNPRQLLGRGVVFVGVVWMLAACGTNAITSPSANAASVSSLLSTVQTLEQRLNEGNPTQALELFSENAVVLEVNPAANTIDYTSGFITLGDYYIPRAYSAAADETFYQGQEQVKSYLSKLVDQNFQSSNSIYRENEQGITWVCQANSQMQFKAGIQDGKIMTLMVTNF